MRRRVDLLALAFLAFLAFAPANADPAPPVSLDELLAYAREHNPTLRALGYDARALRERAVDAAALPDPKVRLELMDVTNAASPDGSFAPWPGGAGTTRLRVMQPLPFPGKRALRGEQADAMADVADSAEVAERLALEAGIRTAYARYYQAWATAGILRDTLQLIDALERLALKRYSVGLAPQRDALSVQSERTGLKLELVDAERQQREAAAGLNAALPRPADTPLGAPAPLASIAATPDLATLTARARTHSPQIAMAEQGLAAAGKGRELADLDRYPDFSLGLANNNARTRSDTWDLMLEVNVPLQRDALHARRNEAAAREDAARQRVAATTARLEGRLGETLAACDAARDQARLLRDSLLPQAQATYDAARAAYESGQTDFSAVVDAQRQILRARLALLNAEVDAGVRAIELERLTGEPL